MLITIACTALLGSTVCMAEGNDSANIGVNGTGEITTDGGSASTQYRVYILPQPVVWGEDITVSEGEQAVFVANGKEGVLPYTFEWYRRDENGNLSECIKTGVDYEGNTFTIDSAKLSDAGTYMVYMTDKNKNRVSCEMRLTVLAKGGAIVDPKPTIPPTVETTAPVKTPTNVQTGDQFQIIWWIISMAACSVIVLGFVFWKKKKR